MIPKFIRVPAYTHGYNTLPRDLLVNVATITNAKAGTLQVLDGVIDCVYAQTIRGDLPTIAMTLEKFEAMIAEACK